MRLVILSSLAFILGISVLTACNSKETVLSQSSNAGPQSSPSQQAPAPADNARRITAEELHALWENGKVLVVDTRTEPAFKESHIKGAILVPAGDVAAKAEELPRNKMIVTYCT